VHKALLSPAAGKLPQQAQKKKSDRNRSKTLLLQSPAMDPANLRRKDTTKGPPLRILSLG
jgi:hypothetical protein